MCGISGVFNLNNKPVDFNVLKNMSDVQHHRGPDDQGFAGFSFTENTIQPVETNFNNLNNNKLQGGLGFNRLSILDLSINGRQPMISQNGKVVIAYNGETYNAFDFKNELETKGYSFKSKTDTEVLLNLYQQHGIEKMLELINGMFAFCVVDLQLKKLFLARDHVGIKPMYWYKNRDTILFASEIKAFLSHPDFISEINENHVDEYLYYKYVAHDRTLFKNVCQVPPAHYLQIDLKGEKLKKYWSPELSESNSLNKNEALEKLDDVLRSSVKSQLISDVKVGCQLSGGIDSSLVTTFARKHFNANMDTFSVIPKNKRYSEEKYIDQVIAKTNPIAHKFELTPEYFSRNLIKAAWHIDVPLPIPQAVGIKCLAEGSSDFVTVLLSGEGSDELMGGYSQFHNLAFRHQNPNLVAAMAKIPVKGNKIRRQFIPKYSIEDYFLVGRSSIYVEDFQRFRPSADLSSIFEQRRDLFPNHSDLLKTSRVYDMKGWLVNLLNIQDKMTMAHSIENRVPFLDKNIIDLVFSLPSGYFVKGSRNPFNYNSPNKHTKILLKKLTAKYYNNDFVYRTKMGFNQPLNDYYNDPLMKEMVNDLILPGIKKRGILDYNKTRTAWGNVNKSSEPSSMLFFWTSLTFELWAQLFIDQKISQ